MRDFNDLDPRRVQKDWMGCDTCFFGSTIIIEDLLLPVGSTETAGDLSRF